ncbi:hypothetical protein AY599_20100 [Leptolyngbya valderiana BDU 20041]|nr:hypothetical protein AY599_20100 [Leptolyngbya valderiana BDU 20041]
MKIMSDSVFLTPKEQALIEADRELLKIADCYRHAEKHTTGSDLRDLVEARLKALERSHEAFRSAIEDQGRLPHAPEQDAQDLKQMAATVRSWIAEDEDRSFIAWLIDNEESWLDFLTGLEVTGLPGVDKDKLIQRSRDAIQALNGCRSSS